MIDVDVELRIYNQFATALLNNNNNINMPTSYILTGYLKIIEFHSGILSSIVKGKKPVDLHVFLY